MGIFNRSKKKTRAVSNSVWARQGMSVTFRAEIMPGKSREERTFQIERVTPSGRVILADFLGEHRQGAFEPINFLRELAHRNQKS